MWDISHKNWITILQNGCLISKKSSSFTIKKSHFREFQHSFYTYRYPSYSLNCKIGNKIIIKSKMQWKKSKCNSTKLLIELVRLKAHLSILEQKKNSRMVLKGYFSLKTSWSDVTEVGKKFEILRKLLHYTILRYIFVTKLYVQWMIGIIIYNETVIQFVYSYSTVQLLYLLYFFIRLCLMLLWN